MDEERIREIFKEAQHEVFNERKRLPEDIHYDHHDWIKIKMKKEQQRDEFCNDMRKHLAKFLITGALATIITVIWYAIKHWTHHA